MMNRRRSQAEEQATQVFFQTLSPALLRTCSASDSVLSSSSCHPSLLQLERDANSDARVMRTDHRSQFCVSPLPSKPEPWRPDGRPPSHARSRPSPYPRQCIESCCTTQKRPLTAHPAAAYNKVVWRVETSPVGDHSRRPR